MSSKNKFLLYISLINFLLIKFLLLKGAGINLNKLLKNLNSDILSINKFILEKIIYYQSKGIDANHIIRYLSNLIKGYEIKVILDNYNINKKVDELYIITYLEKNKMLLQDLTEKINFYFILFVAVLYPLPIVLIVSSFLIHISEFILLTIPLFFTYLIYRKLKKEIAYEE
jgi:hypothetical protein